MSLIVPKYFNCIATLGVKTVNGNIKCIGTGFYIGREIKDSQYHVFLVTNKHIIKDKDQLYSRFKKNNGILYTETIPLIANGEKCYSEHPDPNVDVVVIHINGKYISDNNVDFNFIDIDNEAVSTREFMSEGGCDGTGVFMLGYPMGMTSIDSNHPICRYGCVARLDEKEIISRKNILLDIQNFPGNSGSPIFIKPEAYSLEGTKAFSRSVLYGIVHSYIPYRVEMMNTQTGEIVEVREENSGLANANPVEFIRETLDIEMNRVQFIHNNKKKEHEGK